MKRYPKLALIGILLWSLTVPLQGREAPATPRKSLRNAFLFSVLLPGAGEYYLGYRQWSTFFVSLESCFWLGMVGCNYYGKWKQEDAVAYAAEHAQINDKATAGDESFYRVIGDYQSLEDYNRYQTLNDNTDELFEADAGYDWYWDDKDNRTEYVRLRRSSFLSYRRAYYMGGGMLLNRIVSALNTIRLVRAEEKVKAIKGTWQVRPAPDKITLRYTRRF